MPPSLPSDATGTSVGCHSGARKLPSDASAVGAAESDFRRMPLVQVVEKWARGGRTSVGCHSLPSDASGEGCEQAVTDGAPPRDCLARPWGRAEVRWLSWTAGATIVQQRAAWSAWRPRECGWRPGGVRAGHGAALTSGIRRKFGEKCLWVLPRSADDGAWADLARAA